MMYLQFPQLRTPPIFSKGCPDGHSLRDHRFRSAGFGHRSDAAPHGQPSDAPNESTGEATESSEHATDHTGGDEVGVSHGGEIAGAQRFGLHSGSFGD